jgi:solute:Na+ symporter, SSS family
MNPTILSITAAYFALTLCIGFFVARREGKKADDYFLAGRRLPWYAVSLSMTGSNIGTEHFIGMVGTAYAFGLAPATFEWGNFIPYTVLLWIFLPFFYRKKLYTIPEFLERRYNGATRGVFALLSLFHMVFVVLAPALYVGGRIVYEMALGQPVDRFSWAYMGCVLIIAGVTAAYCIYGGLKSVVWTDVLQVAVLAGGGAILLFVGAREAGGFDAVIRANLDGGADRFSLILPADHKVSPWTGVATFWFTLSMWYVGTNQFYIQRCLGARSEWDARMGVIGCGLIKVFLPLIIVFPGLVAFALFGPGLAEDAVYVKMINELLPPAGRGLLLAALIAAIMSTVSSVLNSSSTIWSIDVHRRLFRPKADDGELVRVGRWSTLVIIVVGTAFAPLLLWWEGGIFIYIQDMAAFLAPPITVIFLAAFLWKGAHGRAACFTLLFGIVSGVALKVLAETWGGDGIETLKPLLNRAAVNWALCLAALVAATAIIPRNREESYDPDAIWNTRWARLPESERERNGGGRSLIFWWLVMVAASGGLFILFR